MSVWGWGSDEEIDIPRILLRAEFYARRAGASSDMVAATLELLSSSLGRRILALPAAALHR